MALQEFEGRTVVASGVEMPGASGGLNKALVVNDLELHHGDTGVLVIEFTVGKVRFDPIKDTDQLERVHVLRVTNASPVDEGLVRDVLDQQVVRQEEAKGIKRLPYSGDDPDAADDEAEVADLSSIGDA